MKEDIKLNFTQDELNMLAKKHEKVVVKEEEKVKKMPEKAEAEIKFFKKKSHKDISHNKRKLYEFYSNIYKPSLRVLTNLPPKMRNDELREFFQTYLATLSKKQSKPPR